MERETHSLVGAYANGLTPRSTPNTYKEGDMFYWYTFADGYRCCVRGFDRVELRAAERKHGKLVNKTPA